MYIFLINSVADEIVYVTGLPSLASLGLLRSYILLLNMQFDEGMQDTAISIQLEVSVRPYSM